MAPRYLELATYDSVAFRFIAANVIPITTPSPQVRLAAHDKRSLSRRRFLKEIEALFVQVLLLARKMGLLKVGTVALDGTKIHAENRDPRLSPPAGVRPRRPGFAMVEGIASNLSLGLRHLFLHSVCRFLRCLHDRAIRMR